MEPVIAYADECAERFCLERRIVPGGNDVMQKLISGQWDEDIIVKELGSAVTEEEFSFEGEAGAESGPAYDLYGTGALETVV
jgi:hypothetical protein